jgi:lipopolysaccharide export system permease protein
LVQQVDGKTQRLSLTRFADFTYDLAGLIPHVKPGARNIDALSTAELLAANPADLAETGSTRAEFLYDGHNRFAQPFLAVGAALIGFAALLMGSFSRFGLWRQVGVAIVLLVAVQGVSSAATGVGLRTDRGWIWAYAAPIFGMALGIGMLWWSERPRRVRRAFA